MAIGWYIKDGKRDGVPTRIEVEVVEGVLYLHVEGAQRKRKVLIEIPIQDLNTILRMEDGRIFLPTPVDSMQRLDDPVDKNMDPGDAAQILGTVAVEDDFTPKS